MMSTALRRLKGEHLSKIQKFMDGMAPEVIYVVSFSISNRYVTMTGQVNAFIAIFHVL